MDSEMKTKLSEYVKVAEAAAILGVTQGTLRNWDEAGKLPIQKPRPAVNDCSNERISRTS